MKTLKESFNDPLEKCRELERTNQKVMQAGKVIALTSLALTSMAVIDGFYDAVKTLDYSELMSCGKIIAGTGVSGLGTLAYLLGAEVSDYGEIVHFDI